MTRGVNVVSAVVCLLLEYVSFRGRGERCARPDSCCSCCIFLNSSPAFFRSVFIRFSILFLAPLFLLFEAQWPPFLARHRKFLYNFLTIAFPKLTTYYCLIPSSCPTNHEDIEPTTLPVRVSSTESIPATVSLDIFFPVPNSWKLPCGRGPGHAPESQRSS